jgi:hypothetical protein
LREVVAAPDLRGPTVPLASNIATRVSPRSTLTNTCFFNCLSVLLSVLPGADLIAPALRN